MEMYHYHNYNAFTFILGKLNISIRMKSELNENIQIKSRVLSYTFLRLKIFVSLYKCTKCVISIT